MNSQYLAVAKYRNGKQMCVLFFRWEECLEAIEKHTMCCADEIREERFSSLERTVRQNDEAFARTARRRRVGVCHVRRGTGGVRDPRTMIGVVMDFILGEFL
mgnify:CR=1 FL=1